MGMKSKPDTEHMLLGVLMNGPKHGYEIKRQLEATVKTTWQVSTSQIYTLLKRLETTGRIRSMLEAQTARPSRRVFSLTHAGRTAFKRWVDQPVGHVRDFRMEFITKLHFLHALGLTGGNRLIDRQIAMLKKRRTKLDQQRNAAENNFTALVFEFKLASTVTALHWLEEHARPFFMSEAG